MVVEDDHAASGALLIVLLETHLEAWQALTKSLNESATPQGGNANHNISPPALIAAVAAFVGAYELESEGNSVVVLGVHAGECPVLYRSPWLREGEEGGASPKPIAETLASAVAELVEAEIEGAKESSSTKKKKKSPSSSSSLLRPRRPALSAALARAVCIAAASDGPTAGEAEILSAEPAAVGAEHSESAEPSSSSRTTAAAAAAPEGGEERERARPRVLVLAATPASGEAYIPLMNCVFAAQRLRVTVDVCELVEGAAGVDRAAAAGNRRKTRGTFAPAAAGAATGGGGGGWATAADEGDEKQQTPPATSTLLSQAAHLTGGVVVSPFGLSSSSPSSPSASASPPPSSNPTASLLQTLMAVFAPGGRVRRWLSLPKTGAVDMRASCFCHKRPIDVGFVCSVCLSIFCEKKATCSTCGADFKAEGGGGGGAVGDKRPLAGGGGGASGALATERPRLG